MGLIANSSNEITEKIFENSLKSSELISKEEYPDILNDLKQVFKKIDQGYFRFIYFLNFIFIEEENVKFVDTLDKDEKEEYIKIKNLLDDFNNNSSKLNMSVGNIIEDIVNEEEKSDFEKKSDHFSEKSSTSKFEDCLFVHFKDKIFKIKTKNLLMMRE